MRIESLPTTAHSEPFWRGIAEGRVELQWCESCELRVFYPRTHCPDCGGDLRWQPHSGHGHIVTHTLVHRAPAAYADWAPYVLAIVDLDGARMFGVVAGGRSVSPGEPVELVTQFDDLPEVTGMPTPFVFRRSTESGHRPRAVPERGTP